MQNIDIIFLTSKALLNTRFLNFDLLYCCKSLLCRQDKSYWREIENEKYWNSNPNSEGLSNLIFLLFDFYFLTLLYSAGNKILKLDPFPGCDSALIKPLWFSITLRTMDKPMPVPLYSASPCKRVKTLKIRSASACSNPIPLSFIRIR